MKVITLAHQKGGVGKSTIALNLATSFAVKLKVALVDTDAQGSISSIGNRLKGGVDLVKIDDFDAVRKLNYDIVIIDTPPYLSSRYLEIFNISDFVLIPTKAGFFDVLAIRSTVRIVNEAMETNRRLKSGIVINMIKPRSGVTREVGSLLKKLDIKVLETMIFDRVSYARSPITGGVVTGMDEKAKSEMASLIGEMVEVMKGN